MSEASKSGTEIVKGDVDPEFLDTSENLKHSHVVFQQDTFRHLEFEQPG
jgi:hypothetical protein